MKKTIYALQKVTLLDYPGKISCTVFSWGCNFRCGFCHNPELVTEQPYDEMISWEDVITFLKTRIGKLDGVVFCGGEPTINNDLISHVKQVKDLGYLVKIDTNGSNPEVVKQLIDNKLVDYWAMDVKGSPQEYRKVIGVKTDIEKIKESIALIKDSGVQYEFRMTFVPGLHDEKSAKGIGELVQGVKWFTIQNFRKGKTIDPVFCDTRSFTKEELEIFKDIIEKYAVEVKILNVF